MIREQEEIPVSLYYAYYLDKKDSNKALISLLDFDQLIVIFLFNYQDSIIMTQYGQRVVRWDNIIEKIYDHFNKKFEC